MLNFSDLRQKITIDQIKQIMKHWGIILYEEKGGTLIFPTVCHNHLNEASSMKLYYYDNNKVFKCYTECDCSFDVFDLGVKIYKLKSDPKSLSSVAYEVSRIIDYEGPNKPIGYRFPVKPIERSDISADFKIYDKQILNYFNTTKIPLWESEGINIESMKKFNIGFYAYQNKITIPHFDYEGNLIGIRGRALNLEDIEKGKYMPLLVSGTLYSHPLSFNLYGLHLNKDPISKTKRVFLFEGEKSVLLADTYYGEDSIAVACCGSSINKFQLFLLIKNCGVKEVVVCFDRQFETKEEELKYFNKLDQTCAKYSKYCQMSFIFDDKRKTNYKDSPIDCGKEIFENLVETRVRSK